MSRLYYTLLDPTGNRTVLADPADPKDQPSLAARIMEQEPSCEQVGFLSEGTGGTELSLRMAGGEFCGNATLSAAALFCSRNGLSAGESRKLYLHVSGANGPVPVTIRAVEADRFEGTVTMPRPLSIETVELPLLNDMVSFPLVRFAGISHLILEGGMDRSLAESVIRPWCRQLHCDGLGLMLLDTEAHRMTPLVYVPAVDTLFWESSCASGTSAAGAYLSWKCGDTVSLGLQEPGGTLLILAESDGTLQLSGQVRIVSEGSLEL